MRHIVLGQVFYPSDFGKGLLQLELQKKPAFCGLLNPTGTGKRMIAFRLAQEHEHQRFLCLSPSEYIVRTQLENVRKADPSADFSHVQFMTYARLMLLNDEGIAALRPDFIILDEFHRCGAEMWGEGVQRLLDRYPAARLLGLSATKIRYLDHQRDMVTVPTQKAASVLCSWRKQPPACITIIPPQLYPSRRL